MSLKLLKLRLKIFFLTIIGQIKQQRPKVKLNQDEGSNSKILIIFPSDEPSFRVACYSFRNIGNNTNRKNDMIFLVNNQFKDIFHFGFGKTIYINNTKPSSILSDEKLILNLIHHEQFQLIIDLNTRFYLGISKLVSNISCNMKIGFDSDFSDKFYNFQLDISKSGVMEKGFKQINGMIK